MGRGRGCGAGRDGLRGVTVRHPCLLRANEASLDHGQHRHRRHHVQPVHGGGATTDDELRYTVPTRLPVPRHRPVRRW